MKKNTLILWVCVVLFLIIQIILIGIALPRFDSKKASAPSSSQLVYVQPNYVRANVDTVLNTRDDKGGLSQQIKATIVEGVDKNTQVAMVYGIAPDSVDTKELKPKDQIITIRSQAPDGGVSYTVFEKYRLDSLLILLVIFIACVLVMAGARGLGAIISLVSSILVIFFFVIPQLSAGANVLLIGVIAAIMIATISLFLSHGFALRTRLAWVAMIATLLTAVNVAIWSVGLAKLGGVSGDESIYLQSTQFGSVNFIGVAIIAIVIAAVGVLDDVTTAQASVVDELHKANPGLNAADLFLRSMSVGREHIASMVNSLVMVYLGSSFTTFLAFFGSGRFPWYITLNLEMIAKELVASLVVSLVLVFAVPATSFLVAFVLKNGFRGGKKLLTFPKMSLLTKK